LPGAGIVLNGVGMECKFEDPTPNHLEYCKDTQ